MANTQQEDPVRPRRSKRPSSAISPIKPAEESHHVSSSRTPSKARPKKKARFSEPAIVTAPDSTGLTPWVGKTSLKTPKRRASTPAPATRHHDSDSEYDQVQFTPFRETLEPRTIRRIRRHGLSEEMHKFEADNKSKEQLQQTLQIKEKEVQRLKDELQQARDKNTILQDDINSSQGIIDEAEAQLHQLRQSFNDDTEVLSWSEFPDRTSPANIDNDNAGVIHIYEDEDVSSRPANLESDDALAMGLELESARQAKQALFRSSQTGPSLSNLLVFADSPVKPTSMSGNLPSTPATFYQDLSKQLKVAMSRAEDAELALQAMTVEIQSLGFSYDNADASSTISNIKSHFRQMRLNLERIIPGETVGTFDNANLLPEIMAKLRLAAQTVRDRESELKSMRDQQKSLKGNFDHAILAAEKANARVKDLEEALDKNAEEMLEIRMRAQSWEREAKEHEANNQSLIAALDKYRGEVTRLEQLVQLVESEQASRLQDVRNATLAEFRQQVSDLEAKAAAETRGRRAAEDSAVERLKKINELESTLTSARQMSEDLHQQLRTLEKEHSGTISTHTAETGNLNSRVSNLATALASANQQIERLQTMNSRLEDRYRHEVDQGAIALERIQTEYVRSVAKMNEERKKYLRRSKVRLANWDIESDGLIPSDDITGPMTPASMVRFADDVDVEEADTHHQPEAHSHSHSNSGGYLPSDPFSPHSSVHVPGSVEMSRGRSKRPNKRSSLKRSHSDVADLGLGDDDDEVGGDGYTVPSVSEPTVKRGRRRYDSGIGMDDSVIAFNEIDVPNDGNDENNDGEEDQDEDLDRSMLSDPISPDLSSELDLDLGRGRDALGFHVMA
ncbi:hypothetical protein PV10_03043 [Exophiala mesophila]|uniref:Uncharacterized protein n=1 Tax=Exophiala mesophila TaxID=212818 RepID=A0A0D1ZN48_EXOME|nr:uncharacterized protein PV10_03043 [Exophiala mesophila]KIV95379.1 hypothetical protein PV10_03043 [Exophiala mesophila]